MADGDGENPNKERVIHNHVLYAVFGWFEISALRRSRRPF